MFVIASGRFNPPHPQVLSKKMSKNFALDKITQRYRKEMDVIAKKASTEQNRLIGCRDKCLKLLNFHSLNTEVCVEVLGVVTTLVHMSDTHIDSF
jgi:hypothetical protein